MSEGKQTFLTDLTAQANNWQLALHIREVDEEARLEAQEFKE
jgi:hypothetical protein